ncbi:50S ribosomal protein L22 [Candidatus Woesearchaeota archaeon]|nr:50S ribosomal protein L22 [Candidatus Woesearchaeota archaeon]
MARYNYAFQSFDPEHMARAVGRDLGISPKHSIELCRFLKNKNVQKAKTILNDVIAKKQAVPSKIFTGGASHRKGKMAGGRYPVTAASALLSIIENAEANAQQKGLNTANLVVMHLCAQRASRPFHAGRFRGRKMKRSHIEVVVAEQQQKKESKKGEKTRASPAKKEATKTP